MKLLAPIENKKDLVNKEYVDNAIDAIEIGGRNLLPAPVNDTDFGSSKDLRSVRFRGWHITTELIDPDWNNRYGEKLTYKCWLDNTSGFDKTGIMLLVTYADGTYYEIGGGYNGALQSYMPIGEKGWCRITITIPDPTTRPNPTTITSVSARIRHNAKTTEYYTHLYRYAKVELGDKATDWTPAPEDVTTEIKNAVNAIEIGGRNYISNSAFLSGSTGWSCDPGVTIDNTTLFNNHPTLKIEQSGFTADEFGGASTSRLPQPSSFSISTGEIVTISFWYYLPTLDGFDSAHLNMQFAGTKEGASSSSAIYQFRQAKSSLAVGKWTKIEVPITATNNYTKCYINTYISRNGLIWLADFKLEKGNKATDWTPAPEDFYTTATPIGYGTCDTAAATAEKAVIVSSGSNWTLTPGAMVCVKFTNTNTAQNPTLNVNETGVKRIVYGASLISTSNLGYAGYANRYINYVYNGSNYVFIGWSIDSNTTYSVVSQSANGLCPKLPDDLTLFLRSDGTWQKTTDEKVKMEKINPSTYTAYYIPFGSIGTSTQSVNDGMRYGTVEGTTTSNGYGCIFLGNDISSETEGNKYGALKMYDTLANLGTLKTEDELSGNRTWSLPDKSGTIALTSDIPDIPDIPTIPNSFGKVVVGSTTISADSISDSLTLVAGDNVTLTPDATNDKITISASYSTMKGATSSAAGTSGLVPAPAAGKQASFLRGDGTWVVPTDTKVTQAAAITTDAEYPIILGYNTATTFQTNTVNKTSTLLYNPKTQTLTAPNLKATNSIKLIDADNSGAGVTVESAGYGTQLTVFSSGNRGLYDTVQGDWIIRKDANNNLHLGDTTIGSTNIPIYLNAGTPTSIGESVIESKQNLGIPITIEAGIGNEEITNNGWFKVFEVPMVGWRSYAITMDIAPCNYVNNYFTPVSVTVIGRASGTGMYAPVVYLSNGDNSSILDKLYIVQNDSSVTESFEIWYKDVETYSQLEFVIYNYHVRGSLDSNLLDKLVIGAPTTPVDAITTNKTAYSFSDVATYQSIGGNAGSATKLATARTIDGVDFNGTAAIIHYGTCGTAAGTAAKVVACTGYKLVTGSTIRVKFTVTNTVDNPTLNVNSTGAKAIMYRGSAISKGYLAANRVYEFVYDGTDYELVGDINTDTNTDTKATQTNTTTNADYRVILSTNANNTTETNTLRKSGNFIANPNTGEFYAKGYRRTAIVADTEANAFDLNTLTLSSGSPQIARYICKLVGHSNYVTNLPVANQPFILDVELIRFANSTDYVTKQTFVSVGAKFNDYVRYCTSGTWSTWTKRVFTDTTYTSLKNPYALTIKGNGTTLTNGVYDGSAAKTVNITASNVGALPISGGTLTGNLIVQENGVKIGKNTTDNYGYIDLYYGDTKCGNIYGTSVRGFAIKPTTDVSGTIGTEATAFGAVYSRILVARQGNKEYGRISCHTPGTTSTEGVGYLAVGNGTAKGTAGNGTGQIRMYGSSTGYTTIKPGYNSTSNITLTLPSSGGTIALKSDIPNMGDYLTRSMVVAEGGSSYTSTYYPSVTLTPGYGSTILLEVWSDDGLLHGQGKISSTSTGTVNLIESGVNALNGILYTVTAKGNGSGSVTFSFSCSGTLSSSRTRAIFKVSAKGLYES